MRSTLARHPRRVSRRRSPTKAAPSPSTPHRLGLFEHLHDVCYFVKDRAGLFIAANDALVRMIGRTNQNEIIGLTDFELISPYLADTYLADDESVMSTGQPIINKVELVTHNDLSAGWYTTTKLPLYDASGTIVGLEGMTREFKAASGAVGPYPELAKVIDFVEQNFASRITVADLAAQAGATVRTLERIFQRRFSMSPFAYIKRVRLNSACRLLSRTNIPIAQIAAESGFCDQSYMTKEFARLLRITPQAYRDSHSA